MSKPTIDEIAIALYKLRLAHDGRCAFCIEKLEGNAEYRIWHLKEKHNIDVEES